MEYPIVFQPLTSLTDYSRREPIDSPPIIFTLNLTHPSVIPTVQKKAMQYPTNPVSLKPRHNQRRLHKETMMLNNNYNNRQELSADQKIPLANLGELSTKRAELLAEKERLLNENRQISADIKHISAENKLNLKKIEYFKASINKASQEHKNVITQTPQGFFACASGYREPTSNHQATSSQQPKARG